MLVLTARDSVEDRLIDLRSGADDYLIKPFVFEELVARVDALVRRRRASQTHDDVEVGIPLLGRCNSYFSLNFPRFIEL